MLPKDAGTVEAFLNLTKAMEVQSILIDKTDCSKEEKGWPPTVLKAFRVTKIRSFVAFQVRLKEIIRVEADLRAEGVMGIYFKGIPFALNLYPSPHHRPSSDADLLISRSALPIVERIMTRRGYVETPDLLFGTVSQQKQFSLQRGNHLEHVFEFHLASNNRPLLSPYSYEAISERCINVDFETVQLKTIGSVESFLLSALHLRGHLEADRRFLWYYDLKLLADRFGEREWMALREESGLKECQLLMGATLSELRSWAPESVPDAISEWATRVLEDRGEASAYYLQEGRSNRSDFWVTFWSLPRWRDRLLTV